MSLAYQAVSWNPTKKSYDLVIAAICGSYLLTFVAGGLLFHPNATAETLLIRALGTLGFLLLHLVLAIGPLCRLFPVCLPLLYNRRHLGVTMFLVGLAHGAFSLVQFHALGDVNPLVSLLTAEANWSSGATLPFQLFGLFALLILFCMAATSHDFWLKHLTPAIWKSLHMLVYVAYALLIAHMAFGALQSERHSALLTLAGLGAVTLVALHLLAAYRTALGDQTNHSAAAGFVDVCRVDQIPEKRARIVCLAGERVAVFRYDGLISAVSNVCEHQNGPIGEGKIVAGCITCPWHGYQYLPDSGASPPPFTERIPTYRVAVTAGRVLVHPQPHPPGTRLEPARIHE